MDTLLHLGELLLVILGVSHQLRSFSGCLLCLGAQISGLLVKR